jgi:hypothetical protein
VIHNLWESLLISVPKGSDFLLHAHDIGGGGAVAAVAAGTLHNPKRGDRGLAELGKRVPSDAVGREGIL